MTDDEAPTTTAEDASGPPESPFVMKLSLSVLDDLGVNLYSNTAAVLSEAVANAWDADAPVRGDFDHHPTAPDRRLAGLAAQRFDPDRLARRPR